MTSPQSWVACSLIKEVHVKWRVSCCASVSVMDLGQAHYREPEAETMLDRAEVKTNGSKEP